MWPGSSPRLGRTPSSNPPDGKRGDLIIPCRADMRKAGHKARKMCPVGSWGTLFFIPQEESGSQGTLGSVAGGNRWRKLGLRRAANSLCELG